MSKEMPAIQTDAFYAENTRVASKKAGYEAVNPTG